MPKHGSSNISGPSAQAAQVFQLPPVADEETLRRLLPDSAASPETMENRERFLAGLLAKKTRVLLEPAPVPYTDAIIAAILKQWPKSRETGPAKPNGPDPDTGAAASAKPNGPDPDNGAGIAEIDLDTAEEEERNPIFAGLLRQAKELQENDDAGRQDLMYRASKAVAKGKLSEFQAQILLKAIRKSTGFDLPTLKAAWKKLLKKAREEEEEEAAAKAAAAGPSGAGAGAGAGAGTSSAGAGGASSSFWLDGTGLWQFRDREWKQVSQAFEMLGKARSSEDEDWGRVIKFANADNRIRKEFIPAAMLHDDPNAVVSRLASIGMDIEGQVWARQAFAQYLLSVQLDERVTLARRVGWIEIGGERAFVLPNEIIGVAFSEEVILAQDVGAPYAQRGTLDQWRDAIARPAGDHLMARLVISTSLSGPLLYLGGFESGIIHLKGDSSIGKTTLLRVAASSWGSGADNCFVRIWRSTDNALEATLASANDTLLPLDEIAQVDTRVIGAVVYMITGQTGKARMRRDATVRPSHQWRTLVLSCGEKPFAVLLAEGHGKRAHAGQLVRALDIPAKRTKNSAFDLPTPDFDLKAFVEEMKCAASGFYGTAGPAFVRMLIDAKIDGDTVRSAVNAFAAKALEGVKDDSGQAHRAAQRFGIIATAGELAIKFGLLPWPEGQLIEDAHILFKAWLRGRGGAEPAEIGQMISAARYFIEAHGESRFDLVEPVDPDRKPVNNRAGFRLGEGDGRRWLVLPEVWKNEVCAGFDSIDMARVLADRGMLEPGEGNHLAQNVRLPSMPGKPSSKPQRLYIITPAIFES